MLGEGAESPSEMLEEREHQTRNIMYLHYNSIVIKGSCLKDSAVTNDAEAITANG